MFQLACDKQGQSTVGLQDDGFQICRKSLGYVCIRTSGFTGDTFAVEVNVPSGFIQPTSAGCKYIWRISFSFLYTCEDSFAFYFTISLMACSFVFEHQPKY